MGQCNNVATMQCMNDDDKFIMPPDRIQEYSQVNVNTLPRRKVDKKWKVQMLIVYESMLLKAA